MMSSKFFKSFNNFPKLKLIPNKIKSLNLCTKTTGSVVDTVENVEKIYLKSNVQKILKKITGLDYEKVFAVAQSKLQPPIYQFATEKRLKKLRAIAAARAAVKLQMPPVMSIRKNIEEVLSYDPELQGYLKDKYIFIDITPSVSSRNRQMTVRETDGTLRKANWDERDRMNQIFYPLPGRNLEVPKMYDSPYFDRLLEDKEYSFILDSACCQFEPDDPEYHRVTSATYEHIKNHKEFEVLRSTRHFGPMAFYFALKKDIDSLLIDMIERQLISDAYDYIKLLCIIHKNMAVPTAEDESNHLEVIEVYIQNYASQKGNLELAFQSYIEKNAEKNENILA